MLVLSLLRHLANVSSIYATVTYCDGEFADLDEWHIQRLKVATALKDRLQTLRASLDTSVQEHTDLRSANATFVFKCNTAHQSVSALKTCVADLEAQAQVSQSLHSYLANAFCKRD